MALEPYAALHEVMFQTKLPLELLKSEHPHQSELSRKHELITSTKDGVVNFSATAPVRDWYCDNIWWRMLELCCFIQRNVPIIKAWEHFLSILPTWPLLLLLFLHGSGALLGSSWFASGEGECRWHCISVHRVINTVHVCVSKVHVRF